MSQTTINLKQQAVDFFEKNHIVRERANVSRTGYIYYIREHNLTRHVVIYEENIVIDFSEYLWDTLGDRAETITKANLETVVKMQLRKAPMVEGNECKKLANNQLMFSNGYFDIGTGEFTGIDKSARIFNKFSVVINYEIAAPNPDVFDAMLIDMFGGDEMKVKLAYQIIGAILSNVNTLKKIFLFQGKSQGGKTRLSEIIMSLLDENDIHTVNTVSEITNDNIRRDTQHCKLVCINEGADKKLSSKQVATLKAYADGGHRKNATAFKILVATNYAVTSNSSGSLDKGLWNRFAVLPFPKAMDNDDERVMAFEDTYFEMGKSGIVKKSLEAFRDVIQTGKFVSEFMVNDCMEQDVAVENMTDIASTNDTILKLLTRSFKVDEASDPTMTMEMIVDILKSQKVDINCDNAKLGKLLRQVFGDRLKNQLRSQKMCYNLRMI